MSWHSHYSTLELCFWLQEHLGQCYAALKRISWRQTDASVSSQTHGRVNWLPSIEFSLKSHGTAASKCPHSMRNPKRILDLVLLKYMVGVIMPSDTISGLGSSCWCIRNIQKVIKKRLLKWPTWHNKLQEALERMVWWNKYRVYLSTENLDHPICIYVQHLSMDKNGGDKQWRTLSGARTLCKCRKGKVAVFSYTYSCRKQVVVVEMFTRALVVWMRLNCFAKMSKSLLICGLETVPETRHSVPVVHTSLSILSNVAEDTVAWYQTKKFYFQNGKKSLKHSTVISILHLEAEAEFHIVKISLFGRSPSLTWLETETGTRRWSSLIWHLGQSDQPLSNAHKEKVWRKTGLWQRGTIRVFFLSLGLPSGKMPTWGWEGK